MNAKYQRYIEYIVNDIEAPYFKNMRDQYGLSPDEYEMVLSRVFNLPVTIIGDYVYDEYSNRIYYETSDGFWQKWEYDDQGNKIYYENSGGDWNKYKYDTNGKVIYIENSDGIWQKWEYDNDGNEIYYEDSYGHIVDKR